LFINILNSKELMMKYLKYLNIYKKNNIKKYPEIIMLV